MFDPDPGALTSTGEAGFGCSAVGAAAVGWISGVDGASAWGGDIEAIGGFTGYCSVSFVFSTDGGAVIAVSFVFNTNGGTEREPALDSLVWGFPPGAAFDSVAESIGILVENWGVGIMTGGGADGAAGGVEGAADGTTGAAGGVAKLVEPCGCSLSI